MVSKGIKLSNLSGIRAKIATMCNAKNNGGNNDQFVNIGKEKGNYNAAVESISGNTFIFKGETYNADGSIFTPEENEFKFEQSYIETNPYSHYFDFGHDNTIQNQIKISNSVGTAPGFSNLYDDKIIKYANKYGLEPNMIKAIIATESSFNPNAKSATNDYGLMQLNAKYNGVVLDVDENIDKGCKIYSDALKAFNGDKTKALIAYNQGITGAKRTLNKGLYETNYSKKVMANYNILNNSKNFGITA